MMDQKEEILKSIEEAGIVIQAQKTVTLSKDEAGSFYDEHKNKEFYGDLCSYMARYEFVLTPQTCIPLGFSQTMWGRDYA